VALLRPLHRVTGTTRSTLRPLVVAVSLTALTAATGVVLTTSVAQAKPLGHKIAEANAQLAALEETAEAATERYNAARIRLSDAQQKSESAQRAAATAERKLASLRRSVSAFGVAAYQGSTIDSSLGVTAESPEAYLDKLTTLQAVANSQSQTLADFAAAQRAQEQAQVTARAALAARERATAQMEADRNEVLAAAHEQQQILQRLQDRQAAIIQAARERAERIAAEEAAAALRARQAAAAAAAAALVQQAPVSPPPAVHGSGGASVAVQWAYRELGKPYQWGAAGPNSFDCSGLTQYVWGKAGVYLDHYTGSQWNQGQHVDRSQLQPGDLVFFGSDLHHVGIYVGSSKMIEAPHTGANVRVSYAFRSDYAGAVRPGT
jgi:peptidoglycan DL-endopeptidase CwlO